MRNKIICTDPDNFQFCTPISEKVFEFKEFNRNAFPELFETIDKMGEDIFNNPKYWISDTVNLEDYSIDSLYDNVCAYYSYSEMLELMENKEYMVLAECCFEMENELY